MAFQGESHIEPEANPIIRLVRRIFPVTTKFHDDKFFVKRTRLTRRSALRCGWSQHRCIRGVGAGRNDRRDVCA